MKKRTVIIVAVCLCAIGMFITGTKIDWNGKKEITMTDDPLVQTELQPVTLCGSVFREKIISDFCFNFSSAPVGSWTTIDFSSWIPAKAHMAVVLVKVWTVSGLPGQVPPFYVRFRRPGEAADTNESNWFYVYPVEENSDAPGSFLTFIPLTDSEGEYTKTYRLRARGKLVGYYIDPKD